MLVAVDGSSHHGLAAVLRRLNSGVAQLVKMAGQQAELPAFELEGPTPGAGGELLTTLRMRRGLQRMQLTLTFSMRQGRIARLHNARS